jgi:hypothetical protein
MIEDRKVSKPIRKNGSPTIQHLKEALKTGAPDPSKKVLTTDSFTTAHLETPHKSASRAEVHNQNAQGQADESSKEQQRSQRGTK